MQLEERPCGTKGAALRALRSVSFGNLKSSRMRRLLSLKRSALQVKRSSRPKADHQAKRSISEALKLRLATA